MRKSTLSFLLIIVLTALLIGLSGLLWAQSSDISDISDIIGVTLDFNKSTYAYGQPVGVTVTVTNKTGRDVYINEGFSKKEYYLEMRVIDPAGRLVLAKPIGEHEEFPDAPPLPFCVKNNGTFTQVASYEILPAGWSKTLQISDLRNYYPLKFPGTYSFQVQLSAMTWNPPPEELCIGDINYYESLGVIKSETKYVYIAGSTEVYVIPKKWLISWKYEQVFPRPELSVTIWPGEGKSIDDYRMDHIQLNNLEAIRVFKQYSRTKNKYYLRAFFDRKDAINSLGNDVKVGKIYSVVISGMLNNNEFFGGGAQIKVINY